MSDEGNSVSNRHGSAHILRDRIAAVLAGATADYLSYGDAYTMADAVIAELGLREERRTNPMSSSGYTVDRTTGEQKWHSDIRHDHRYVTDWKADDG